MGSNPVAVTLYIVPVLSKAFLEVEATTEYRITLKCVCGMIKTQTPLSSLTVRELQ